MKKLAGAATLAVGLSVLGVTAAAPASASTTTASSGCVRLIGNYVITNTYKEARVQNNCGYGVYASVSLPLRKDPACQYIGAYGIGYFRVGGSIALNATGSYQC